MLISHQRAVFLFIVLGFLVPSFIFSANFDGLQKLKAGGIVTGTANPGIILTFNQIYPSSFPVISCFVAVVDEAGNPITNLTNSNFAVTEENQTVPFSVQPYGGDRLDASIALVLDNSGSIDDTEMQEINDAAMGLVNLLEQNDRASIFKFSDNVELSQTFTSNKELLRYAVNSTRTMRGMTALYDAIYDAISLTKLEYSRRAVVALTDGQENASSHNDINEVIEYAVASQIPVFTIGLGNNVNIANLTNIAESTGGLYFASASTKNLLAIFESIGGTIANQYEIQYTSPNPNKDCTLRTTKIGVNFGGDSDQKHRTYKAPCAGEVKVKLPGDVACFPGQAIILQIIVDDVTGSDIYSYQFNLAYNSLVLRATGAQSTGTLTESWGPPVTNSPSSGQIQVGGYGVSPLSGSGVLVELVFDVIGANGDYSTLNFLDFLFNAGNPPVHFIDGFVWVTALEISGRIGYYGSNLPVPRVNLSISPGGTLTSTDNNGEYLISNLARNVAYTVAPSKTPDTDIGQLSILTHDAAYTAQAAFGMRNLTDYEKKAADVDRNGHVQLYDASLIAKYAVNLPKSSDSHVGEWEFERKQISYDPLEGNMRDQGYTAILLGDVTDNWSTSSPLLAKKGSLKMEKIIRWVSSNILRVQIDDDIFAEGIESVDFSLKYDPGFAKISDIEWSKSFYSWKKFENLSFDKIKIGAFSVNKKKKDYYLDIIFDKNFRLDKTKISINSLILNGQPFIMNQAIDNSSIRGFLNYKYDLEQNFPNPFNPNTFIQYSIGKSADTKISVFNSLGQLINILVDEWKEPGSYHVIWNATDQQGHVVSPGIYLLEMKSGKERFVRKMVLVK